MLPERSRGPVLFVPAHPDDEVISASAAITAFGARTLILHVTDGAPRNLFDARNYGFDSRESYAAARRRELEAALGIAGIGPGRLMSLGAVDQEASLALADLALRTEALLGEIRPAEVWTHPYEGGHPDHDAAAFLVHAAVHLARSCARVIEFGSYHASGVLEFLPNGQCREAVRVLSTAERERKSRMIACFATQQTTLERFPIGIERWRPAPAYDFRRPPHEGTLHYDRYDWGMRGERWRKLACEALRTLGIGGAI